MFQGDWSVVLKDDHGHGHGEDHAELVQDVDEEPVGRVAIVHGVWCVQAGEEHRQHAGHYGGILPFRHLVVIPVII